jgi:hypothetical protein
MMADPIDDAIAEAQKAAFRSATAPANVVAIRGGIASIPSGPVCCSVDSFLADTEAPVWVVGGIIQSNYVYAVTAPTNHGKTAVTLVMALCVAAGIAFAGLPVTRGKVLILCGENQDGFRLRMLATMNSLGITLDDVRGRIWVLPQSTGLCYLLEQIKKDAETMGDLTMVLVDTSVAFFGGDNENDNQQAYSHARDLRELSMLPGKPSVVVNCHPAAGAGKDMTRESCVPRGGSAFMNEIDTNLTVWSEGDTAEFHWMRKKRGPDFSPILFEYKAVNIVQHDQSVPTVVAHHIDEQREKDLRRNKKEAESRLLLAMYNAPNGTIREWALDAGFTIKTGRLAGQAHVSFTVRTMERLKEYKLLERSRRDGWILTKAGKEEAKDIR